MPITHPVFWETYKLNQDSRYKSRLSRSHKPGISMSTMTYILGFDTTLICHAQGSKLRPGLANRFGTHTGIPAIFHNMW